jgi:hypothetical protein
MSKIYSLLRNNKQTGPYSLEELVQLQLKPFDLVWAEGKSAGWLYPSEIDALKPYLETTAVSSEAEVQSPKPEVPSPKPEVLSLKPVVKPSQPLAVAEEKKSGPVAPIIPQKKKSSKAIYVSLPAGMNPVQVAVPVPATEVKQAPVQPVAAVAETSGDGAGEEPTESFEARVERMRRRVAAVESKEKVEEEVDEINTKYSRSLDDIKEEYSSWMKEQKSKKRFPVKKMVIGVAALLVLTAGGWLAYAFLSSAPDPVSSAQQPLAEAAIPAVKKESNAEQEYDMPGDASTRAVIERLDHTLEVLEANEKKTAAKKKTTPAETKKRVSDPVRTTPVPAAKKNTETASGKTTQEKSTSPSPQTPRREKSSVPLSKLVNIQGRVVKARKGIDGVEITLQNNSDQTLKLVAVDVLYHKGNNSVIQRETIYFSDIRPGTSRMLVAPGNRNARGANYQLGLISAEDGLYVSR